MGVESFIVGSTEVGRRLDHYLAAVMAAYSRERLKGWIEAGRVRVDGVERKAAYKVREGERVEVEPAELKRLRAEPEAIALDIVYEDEDVVAVNKPAGMVVHAGAGRSAGTLVNALLHHFGSLSGVGGELRPGIVHRLDKGTSGVMLVARNDAAHRGLADQFAGRTVEKTYVALVHGEMKGEGGVVERPIERDRVRRTRMTARTGRGRAALSEYKVVQRGKGYTLVEVRIGTGRTHQIRVHLSALGHPIVGDTLYGAPRETAGMGELGRPWLHSRRIRFVQPVTGELLTIEADVPEELEAWKQALL